MVVIDPRHVSFELTPKVAQRICNRHFGIGADGICYGPLNETQPFEISFFNPDGTQAGKSGNGLRIFARYLCDKKYVTGKEFDISINGQISHVTVMNRSFTNLRISMGRASFNSRDIPATGLSRNIINETLDIDDKSYQITCVNVGNPHCVIFQDQVSENLIKELGSKIEVHPMFPQRTNVQCIKVLDEHNIHIEIWERGACYTLASGTSACATACASIVNNFCSSPVTVHMPGGEMLVDVNDNWQLQLTGSVQAIASGTFSDEFIPTLV